MDKKYYKNSIDKEIEVSVYWEEQAYLAQNTQLPSWAIEFDPLIGEFYSNE